MKKTERDLFYNEIDLLIIQYGDDDDKGKVEFVKTFLKEKFQVHDFEDSFIDFERMGTKSILFLFVSLLIEYQKMNQNSNKQFLNFFRCGEYSPNKMNKRFEIMRKLKKIEKDTYYLEVDDIFPIEDRTTKETRFIERCLDKIHVDLESEDDEDIILSKKQLIYLITGIIREWDTFKDQNSQD
jgi:hypothetical protein